MICRGKLTSYRRLLICACALAPLLAAPQSGSALAQNADQPARPAQPAQPQLQGQGNPGAPAVPGQIQVQIGQVQIGQVQIGQVQVGQVQSNIQPWTPDSSMPLESVPTPEQLATVTIDAHIAELVAGLDAPAYEQRERAMMDLMDVPCEIAQLYAALARKDLSLEQRYRLLAVVRTRMVDAPRGAMGVRMEWQQKEFGQPGAVQIQDLIEGLPAKGVLRRGDRITQVDGHQLWNQNDLIVIVQNKRPGDMVRLTVERQRTDESGDPILDASKKPVVELVPIDIALGSADQLPKDNPASMSGSNVVLLQRHSKAQMMEQQFAPTVQHVALPRTAGTDAVDEQAEFESDVDNHPFVQQLLGIRRAMASGQVARTPELRATCLNQLEQLRQMAMAPGLDEKQREYFTNVWRRYAELVPP